MAHFQGRRHPLGDPPPPPPPLSRDQTKIALGADSTSEGVSCSRAPYFCLCTPCPQGLYEAMGADIREMVWFTVHTCEGGEVGDFLAAARTESSNFPCPTASYSIRGHARPVGGSWSWSRTRGRGRWQWEFHGHLSIFSSRELRQGVTRWSMPGQLLARQVLRISPTKSAYLVVFPTLQRPFTYHPHTLSLLSQVAGRSDS